MTSCMITGVAGFIGSRLAASLLSLGWRVSGIDSFDPYYPRTLKEANLECLSRAGPAFRFFEKDLTEVDIAPLLQGAEYVFHLAARPGVRGSWGDGFPAYERNNVRSTQRLLEAVASTIDDRPVRVVFASSSSVYGDAQGGTFREDGSLSPLSPYGATKVCGEGLCSAYARSRGLDVVCLRYFTVYGPGQRPDMGIRTFIDAALNDRPARVFGSGDQARDFTYVNDAVDATIRAAILLPRSPGLARAINVGSGRATSVNRVIEIVDALAGHPLARSTVPEPPGNPRATLADTSLLRSALGFSASTPIEEGLARQYEWQRNTAAHRDRAR